MNADDPSQDPGWGRVGPRLLLFLIPGYPTLFFRGKARSVNDGLVALRQLWLTFVAGILLFGLAVLFVVPGSEQFPAGPWIVALAGIGSGGVAASLVLGRRPLDCTGMAELAGSYRTRFFIRLAFSEIAALFGFVGSFVSGHWWLYWFGAAFTLVGFALIAPTRAHLASDQYSLSHLGCSLSLTQALRAPLRKD